MEGLSWRRVTCPQCGHHYALTIDLSVAEQDYYESCPACCAEFVVHLRQQLYQLYYLIHHARVFGGHYVEDCRQQLKRLLACEEGVWKG